MYAPIDPDNGYQRQYAVPPLPPLPSSASQDMLAAISHFAPTMPLRQALRLVEELRRIGDGDTDQQEMDKSKEYSQRVIHAALWAEKSFGPQNRLRKIGSIMHLRSEFSGLGLLEAKHIVENISWTGHGVSLKKAY